MGRALVRKGWSPLEEVEATRMVRAHDFGLSGLRRAWTNNVYAVQLFEHESEWGPIDHLMINRHDSAASRSWADFQRIKEELFGPERVAVEVYPPASELVDQANMYHLWILPAGFRLPFGLQP
jgi:hypothetical protein